MSQPASIVTEPQIGPYRLLYERGEGAFARAYLAEHPADGRLVILKVAHQWNPLVEAAFRQEFLLGSRLRHPHLGEVLDHGRTSAGRPYLVLAYDDGESLAERPGPWSEPELVRLGLQLARALAVLHAQGLVHRDVTPANVLTGPTGHARLIDFGMLTPAGAAGGAAGTPLYLAPEALAGGVVDPRADLYSLGALLYRQACGQAPFEELADDALLDAVLHQSIAPLAQRAGHVSPALAALVMRLLAKDPADRPASALEVAEQLDREAAAQGLPLAEGDWCPPEAWTAWDGLGAAPGVFAFMASPGGGLTRCLHEAYRQVRRMDLPAMLVAAEEAVGPYALVEVLARWAAAIAPAARESLDTELCGRLTALWPWLAPDDERVGSVSSTSPATLAADMLAALEALFAGVAAGGRFAILIDGWGEADPASRALLRKGWASELGSYHWLLGSHEAVAEARTWAVAPMPEAVMRPWLVTCLHGFEPNALLGRLFQLSGGNPGWAFQALQALHQSGQLGRDGAVTGHLIAVPASVEATLELQFAQLSLDQRSLAEVLALYNASFAAEDLAPLSTLLPASWPLELPLLVGRGLLEARGGTYRWATGWWPAWIREQMPVARAGRLAWDLARALERHWFPTPTSARSPGLLHRLAELYERSDDDDARVRFALEAGRACASIFANDSALAHYEHGLAACARLQGHEEQALELGLARADVQRLVGKLDAAAAAYEAALEHIEAPVARGRTLVSLGKCRQMLNQFDAARLALESALALLSTTDAVVERLRGLTTLGRVLVVAGHRDEGAARYEEALALARATGERAYQAEALAALGQALAGRARTASQGLAMLQEALALREALRDQLGRYDAHMLLGNALMDQGRFAEARTHFEANLQIAGRTGNRSDAGFAHINLALTELELGLFGEALANARSCTALGQSLGDDFLVGLAGYCEAQAALHLGNLASVERSLAVARARERALGLAELRLYGLLFEAERHLFMGQFGQALRAGELALGLVADGVGSTLAARAQLIVAEAWLHEGRPEKAETALAAAREAIAETGAVGPAVAAEHVAGLLAFRGGRATEALACWDRALEQARAQGLRALEARVRLARYQASATDLSRRPGPDDLDAAYALAEVARTPEALALACLGLAIHHLEDGRDLLAERVSRRGHDLLALFTQALPGQGERNAFLAHPDRVPYCAARQVEEAHRLQQRSRRLEMLLALAERLGASREPDGVLELVRSFTLEITQAERCLVLVQRAPGDLRVAGDVDAPYSQTLVQRVMATRQAECVLDTRADEGLKAQQSIMDLQVRSVMCVPMALEQVLHGVLYVDSRVALGTFSAEDLRVVEAIARQAAVALDNARQHAIQRGLLRQREEQLRRIQETESALRQRERLDELRGQYFEAESHDLRAPLGSIKAGVQGLLKGLMGPLSLDQIEALESIDYNQRFLMAKIDGILDGARQEADKQMMVPRPVQLARPVREAVRLVAPQASDKGLALVWDEPDLAAVTVQGDERKLMLVAMHLIGNAVKFTASGRVEVGLVPAPAGRVRFYVRDTGPGIPPARRANLFERYGASTESEALAGSGLGLWQVKGLVDLHGGAIEVETAPGIGTTFTVELPAAP